MGEENDPSRPNPPKARRTAKRQERVTQCTKSACDYLTEERSNSHQPRQKKLGEQGTGPGKAWFPGPPPRTASRRCAHGRRSRDDPHGVGGRAAESPPRMNGRRTCAFDSYGKRRSREACGSLVRLFNSLTTSYSLGRSVARSGSVARAVLIGWANVASGTICVGFVASLLLF